MQVYSSVMPPSVVASEGVIYACQGDVFALDAKSGTLRHRYDVRGVVQVAIAGGTLYAATNYMHEHTVQAVHIDDGAVLWSYATEGRVTGVPVVAEDIVYVSIVEGHVVALGAADGALLWRYETGPIVCCEPTIAGNTLFVAPAVNAPDVPVILALDARAAALRWSAPLRTSSTFPLVVAQDVVYVAMHDSCAALAAHNGALLWRQDTAGLLSQPRSGGSICSAPVLADTSVCLSYTESGRDVASLRTRPPQLKHTTFVVALDQADGSLQWRTQVGADTHATWLTGLAALRELIFVGADDGYVYALDAKDGAQRWRFEMGGARVSTPIAADEAIYAGASDGYVYALRTADGALLWRTFTSTAVTVAAGIQIGSWHVGEPKDPA